MEENGKHLSTGLVEMRTDNQIEKNINDCTIEVFI